MIHSSRSPTLVDTSCVATGVVVGGSEPATGVTVRCSVMVTVAGTSPCRPLPWIVVISVPGAATVTDTESTWLLPATATAASTRVCSADRSIEIANGRSVNPLRGGKCCTGTPANPASAVASASRGNGNCGGDGGNSAIPDRSAHNPMRTTGAPNSAWPITRFGPARVRPASASTEETDTNPCWIRPSSPTIAGSVGSTRNGGWNSNRTAGASIAKLGPTYTVTVFVACSPESFVATTVIACAPSAPATTTEALNSTRVWLGSWIRCRVARIGGPPSTWTVTERIITGSAPPLSLACPDTVNGSPAPIEAPSTG